MRPTLVDGHPHVDPAEELDLDAQVIGLFALREEEDDLALDVLGCLVRVRAVMTAAGVGQGRGRCHIGGCWIASEGGIGQTSLARRIFEAGEDVLPHLPGRGMVESDDARTLRMIIELDFHLDSTATEAKEGLE